MRLQSYLQFDGQEIVNSNRILEYINNGLAPARLSAVASASDNCMCDPTNNGPYSSPADDPAPWYDAAVSASSGFLGLLAYEVRIQNILSRSLTPNGSWGSTISAQRLGHRILSVTGLMLATGESSMYFGERWLVTVLGSGQDCGGATVRIITACDSNDDFRTLKRVGVVDGPTFGQLRELPECLIQEVQFQMASGIPHLLRDENECMEETILVGGS